MSQVEIELALHKLGMAELRECCKALHLAGYSKLKKEDLIQFIMDSAHPKKLADYLGVAISEESAIPTMSRDRPNYKSTPIPAGKTTSSSVFGGFQTLYRELATLYYDNSPTRSVIEIYLVFAYLTTIVLLVIPMGLLLAVVNQLDLTNAVMWTVAYPLSITFSYTSPTLSYVRFFAQDPLLMVVVTFLVVIQVPVFLFVVYLGWIDQKYRRNRFYLLLKWRAGTKISFRSLQKELGVPIITIKRWLDELDEMIPIRIEKQSIVIEANMTDDLIDKLEQQFQDWNKQSGKV